MMWIKMSRSGSVDHVADMELVLLRSRGQASIVHMRTYASANLVQRDPAMTSRHSTSGFECQPDCTFPFILRIATKEELRHRGSLHQSRRVMTIRARARPKRTAPAVELLLRSRGG